MWVITVAGKAGKSREMWLLGRDNHWIHCVSVEPQYPDEARILTTIFFALGELISVFPLLAGAQANAEQGFWFRIFKPEGWSYFYSSCLIYYSPLKWVAEKCLTQGQNSCKWWILQVQNWHLLHPKCSTAFMAYKSDLRGKYSYTSSVYLYAFLTYTRTVRELCPMTLHTFDSQKTQTFSGLEN